LVNKEVGAVFNMSVIVSIILLLVYALLPRQATPYGSGSFRGHLTLGHELRSFTPCGKKVDYWVVDRTGGELWNVYQGLTHKPYQSMYVEVRGHLGPPPSEGFGADYERQLTIFEVRRAEIETRGRAEDLRGLAPMASLTTATNLPSDLSAARFCP
jgi:hypothetical protein